MRKVFVLLLVLSAFACKTNQEIGAENPDCTIEATVKDFTGLDGCQFLLVLDNGDKLLPAKIRDDSFILKDGQRIKFAYKELPDMMSICMAENMAVEITCIVEIESDLPPKCLDIVDPERVDWMARILQMQDSKTVRKFKLNGNSWAYLFKSGNQHLLYDCQGTLLCEFEGQGANDCMTQKLASSGVGNIIWRKGGIKHARD